MDGQIAERDRVIGQRDRQVAELRRQLDDANEMIRRNRLLQEKNVYDALVDVFGPELQRLVKILFGLCGLI